jgi:hypothetical protein
MKKPYTGRDKQTSEATAPPRVQEKMPMTTGMTNFGEDTLCPRDYEAKIMTVSDPDVTVKELPGWNFTTGALGGGR